MRRRRRAREQALQMLFQIDLTGAGPEETRRQFWDERPDDEAQRAFTERLVAGVMEHRAELDRLIVGAAENWRLERMPIVDRNVLRVAVWELLHDRETPAAVVIDEAVEVARRFSSAESAAFVNGVLDSIHKRIDKQRLQESEAGPEAEEDPACRAR